MASRTLSANDGLRCPCYVRGQEDLAEAIRVMQRLGLPLDNVLSHSPASDAQPEPAEVPLGPD